MNKKGGMADMFIFMIFAFFIVVVSVIFVYFGLTASAQLHESMDDMEIGGDKNASELIDDTIGKVNQAYGSLYWISIMLMVGMVLSIFIGSYLVTTKPVFFIPYIFVVIIAIIVSVGISNAYEEIMLQPVLASTFDGFIGANYIMLHLPIWMTVIGFVGGIIMFIRMGSKDTPTYGGSYG